MAVDADGDRFPRCAGPAAGGQSETARPVRCARGRRSLRSRARVRDARPAARPAHGGAPRPRRARVAAHALFAVSTFAAQRTRSRRPSGRRTGMAVRHSATRSPGWPAALPRAREHAARDLRAFPRRASSSDARTAACTSWDLSGVTRSVFGPLTGPIRGRSPSAVAGHAVLSGSRRENSAGKRGCSPRRSCRPVVPGLARPVAGPGFEPTSSGSTSAADSPPVVHHADGCGAFDPDGNASRVGAAAGRHDSGRARAGDPDGDGFAEVLTQSKESGVAFWDQSGRPSPGWPKRNEHRAFRTDSPPLAVDVTGACRPMWSP